MAKALMGELQSLYPSKNIKAEITHAWSGIICDGGPLVGPIEGRPGQYMSLGYGGTGMVKAFSCGRHVAELIANVTPTCPLIDNWRPSN